MFRRIALDKVHCSLSWVGSVYLSLFQLRLDSIRLVSVVSGTVMGKRKRPAPSAGQRTLQQCMPPSVAPLDPGSSDLFQGHPLIPVARRRRSGRTANRPGPRYRAADPESHDESDDDDDGTGGGDAEWVPEAPDRERVLGKRSDVV